MTVATKLEKTLAKLESAKADMGMYALDTQDPMAKRMFSGFEQELEPIIEGLSGRIRQVKAEEPQYNAGAFQTKRRGLLGKAVPPALLATGVLISARLLMSRRNRNQV